MPEDHYTHTEADAGAFARRYARDYDNRPSLSDLADEEEPLYKIVRFYKDRPDLNRAVVERNLSLAEAKAHCNDPQTSSRTATLPSAVAHTEQYGTWFDGWEEQDGWEDEED